MPQTVTFIDCYAFFGTAFSKIMIKENVEYIGDVAFSSISTLTEISVTATNNNYASSSSGELYDSSGNLNQYPIGKMETNFNIPLAINGWKIRSISKHAFSGAKKLSIVFLNDIENISGYAFTDCTNLETLANDSNVEWVAEHAFTGTQINEKTDEFVTIGKVLYKYNGTAEVINEADFPAAIIRIGAFAFAENDSIREIYLPRRIIGIEDFAFSNCDLLIKIRCLQNIAPTIGINAFSFVNDNIKIYIQKKLIDEFTDTSEWYAFIDILMPIKTRAYFEDLNLYIDFYYGQNVTIPQDKIPGKYIKGWRRVNTETGQVTGGYLTTATWEELVSEVTYRADLYVLQTYSLYFYNGSQDIGGFQITTGDTYQISKEGYTINGTYKSFAYKDKMVNCFYNGYYGNSYVGEVQIAVFDGWEIDGEAFSAGQWLETYSSGTINVYAVWSPVIFTATLHDGFGGTEYVSFNYIDGLELPKLTRENFRFYGWIDSNGLILGEKIEVAYNIIATAQWQREFEIAYLNITFGSQKAMLYMNDSTGIVPYSFCKGETINFNNITAVMHSNGPYTPQFRFLGWFLDNELKFQLTEFAPQDERDLVVFAKWRYDYTNGGRSGTYLITSADPMTQNSDSVYIGFKQNNLYSNLKNMGIKYITINYKIHMREVKDGAQTVFLYLGRVVTENNSSRIEETLKDSFGFSGEDYYTVQSHRFTISINDLKEIDYLIFRYQGSKTWLGVTRNWETDEIYYEIAYVTKEEDINNPEFMWSYQDPF